MRIVGELIGRVSSRGEAGGEKGGGGGGLSEPSCPFLEIVLLKLIIDVDKCLTKCMSSESMHM